MPNTSWSKAEWDAIAEAYRTGLGASDLFWTNSLPGRSVINIQNSLNRYRYWQEGICQRCRKKMTEQEKAQQSVDGTNVCTWVCPACRDSARNRRHTWIDEGLCGECGQPRGDTGSATKCPECLSYHNRRSQKSLERKFASGEMTRAPKVPSLFPWFSTSSRSTIGMAVAGRDVVDLFGGGGRLSVCCHNAGARLRGWNDIHPLLHQFMTDLVQRPDWLLHNIRALWHQIKSPEDQQNHVARYHRALQSQNDPLGSALFYWTARGVKGTQKKPPFPRESVRKLFHETSHILQSVPLAQMDFSQAITLFDRDDRVLLADPPWLGASPFEYRLDKDRHVELVTRLLHAKGDFILTLQSSNTSVQVLREVGVGNGKCPRSVYSYRRWNLRGIELLVSSFPIQQGVAPFRI